jgi:hypothetical protein
MNTGEEDVNGKTSQYRNCSKQELFFLKQE